MADNFLERHQQDYEKRKAAWLKSKRRFPIRQKAQAEKTETAIHEQCDGKAVHP